MYIVLGAVVALGAGGYYFLKPVRDVASTTHQVINSVKGQASGLVCLSACRQSSIAEGWGPL
jgi:hypothetical protein